MDAQIVTPYPLFVCLLQGDIHISPFFFLVQPFVFVYPRFNSSENIVPETNELEKPPHKGTFSLIIKLLLTLVNVIGTNHTYPLPLDKVIFICN